MRPVQLIMNGFASYRDKTVVDFTDTDYFALVGPTGSGKSTILDAISFALYGTAPRWGRANRISHALAPTSNRCTVSLIFDIGSQRYQVAREVRRSGTQIQQKAPSLVLFADPTVVEPDPLGEQPEVLAGDIDGVLEAIEALLGLSFSDFCQCVVLPQGEFSRFLTAKTSERQAILLKLLDAGQYEQLGRRAGSRASQATAQIEILTEQIGANSVTPAEEQAALTHLDTLVALHSKLEDLGPRISENAEKIRTTEANVDTARNNLGLVAGVETPPAVDTLQAALTAATEMVSARNAAREAASAALQEAVDAVNASPKLATLKQHESQYSKRHTLADQVTDLHRTLEQATASATDATMALKSANMRLLEARRAETDARELARAAQVDVSVLQGHLTALDQARAPDDLDDTLATAGAATSEEAAATTALRDARTAQADAQQGLTGTLEPRILDSIAAELDRYAELTTRVQHAHESLESFESARDVAAGRVETSTARVASADDALNLARELAGAGQMRAGLQVGHDCPVCAQSVTTLPPPLADDTVEKARAELAKAHKVLAEAQSELLAAERGVSAHDARTTEASADLSAADTRLAGLLENRPAGDLRDLHGDRASLQSLREARAAAEEELKVAAATATSCDAALEAARATRTQATDRLTSARTRLVHLTATLGSLSAPDLATDDGNLESSWAQFSSWAAGQRTHIATELHNAIAAHDRALGAAEDATTTLKAAESAASTAQSESTATTSTLAAARAEMAALSQQIHDVDEGLAEAPAEAELPDLVLIATRLESALTAAQQALAPAQREAAAAAEAVAEALSAATAARSHLSGARDRLATLGPPTLGGEDLVADWKALTAWATETETALQTQVADLQATLGVAIDDREQLSRTAHDLVETSGQDWDIASDATPQTVLGEAIVRVERARGDLAGITKALQQVAKLVAQLEQTQERQKVAAQLATMMRSERFPRWLAQSALDSLVAGASQTLRDLSGEQFDLTHDKGDFYVIDHYDADSVRSVRTLSGGETFQASLALALTLSEQIAGMTGSVKLESIFLDEGFGTLDSDALETVAGTLENLAQGNRMVGVITHVGELAERAPVRFVVNNDTRTSSIVREGL